MKPLTNSLYVAGQLSSDDFAKLAEFGIKTIINNRPDDEESNQLDHQQAAKLAKQVGMNYHYLPMANDQPLPATLINDFKAIVDHAKEPVLAHCRSGMRSSFIWALGEVSAGNISPEQAIASAKKAGINLENFKQVLGAALNH